MFKVNHEASQARRDKQKMQLKKQRTKLDKQKMKRFALGGTLCLAPAGITYKIQCIGLHRISQVSSRLFLHSRLRIKTHPVSIWLYLGRVAFLCLHVYFLKRWDSVLWKRRTGGWQSSRNRRGWNRATGRLVLRELNRARIGVTKLPRCTYAHNPRTM